MIARAALAIGLAWLMMPHHPDLGLGQPVAQPGDSTRAAIFARLREVRNEIAAQRTDHESLLWDEGRGVALQNASRLPDEVTPASILDKVLSAVGGQQS